MDQFVRVLDSRIASLLPRRPPSWQRPVMHRPDNADAQDIRNPDKDIRDPDTNVADNATFEAGYLTGTLMKLL